MTSTINTEDVKNVAMDIHVEITDDDIQQILEEHDFWQNADPGATWYYVIEDQIYNIINNRN